MPVSQELLPEIEANWSFLEVNRNQRIIQFFDKSIGKVDSWYWDFGDVNSSLEQNPQHIYKESGEWTVILTVEGEAGKSVRSKVWDVVTK
jgi:PKD repeat protein